MASDARSVSYQTMLILQDQRYAAEAHFRSTTWAQPHYAGDEKARAAAIREQLLGAYFSNQARERLFAVIEGRWLPV